jgi:alpha-glucosidase
MIVSAPSQMQWWQSAVLYQVYPRSFQDSNGDGVGDLRGIIERLPYLVELGVDAVWLSPIFVSPMADFGYDISDHAAIDPLFGSMDDFDALVAAAHALGLKVLLDFVPNHTSNKHAWFAESRASRQSAKRDWYIWRNGAPNGGPPNNWLSEFGGPAWQHDAATDQYYYHAFLSAQPDLNWRNAEVRAAMHETMRFWLRRGVDGFRVDVIWHLIKDDAFRDNPPNPDFVDGQPPYQRLLPLYSTDRPEVHDIIAGLRAVIDEFRERLLIGEIYLPVERLAAYYGGDLSGAHLPFNFSLISTPWQAAAIADLIARYEGSLPEGAWPNWVLGNHDRPRLASRIGVDQVKVAAMLLLTLRGTPTLYYGDEIGMRQVAIAPAQVRDPWEKNVPSLGLGRDGCRTPMQWDDSANAGFSAAEPWLPMADDFAAHNVDAERGDPNSVYNLYRRLLTARRTHPALAIGAYYPVAAAGNVLVFERVLGLFRMLVVLNLGTITAEITLPNGMNRAAILVSTESSRDGTALSGPLTLKGHEGVILELHT